MEIRHNIALSITEKSQASEARRCAINLAKAMGSSEKDASNIAIIVTEVAKNLAKHGIHGELLLHELKCEGAVGIEILALDRGPGIANVGQCMQDGYSTAGSPGTGLGAIERISTFFEIYTLPKLGTAVLVRYWWPSELQCVLDNGLDVGAVCIPKPGETVCGDGWAIESTDKRALIMVSDGLGHGHFAAEATHKAIRAFRQNKQLSPQGNLRAIHEALVGTRGAAIAMTEIDFVDRIVRFAGVGNISSTVISHQFFKSMVSHNGIVGGEIVRIQEFTYSWPDQAILLMHSDGLTSRWNLDRYAGLLCKHPSLIAGVLYRDNSRATDDVTVLIVRSKE